MANKMIWLDDEEMEYVAGQAPGYIRKLIRADMTPEDEAIVKARVEAKRAKEQVSERDANFANDNACKSCGAFLPYAGAKTCKVCKAKQ